MPIDFSSCSRAAFNCGAKLASDFHAELRLVHVIDLHCYPFGDQYAALDVERLVREGRNSAQREMRQNGHASKRAVFGSGEKGLTRTGDLHRGE